MLLEDGHVVSRGEHADLLEHDAAYRSVVVRSLDELDDADEGALR